MDMLSGYINYPYRITYFKNADIIHPQKQRCVVGYVKKGGGGVSVKHVIHLLAPYCIYVCGKLQYIPLVLEIVDYCVCGNVNYMSLFFYINGPVGHKVESIQPQEYEKHFSCEELRKR